MNHQKYRNPKSEYVSSQDTPTWEKDFFEKDLAKVVFTEIEDTMNDEGVSEIDSEQISTEFSTNINQVVRAGSNKRMIKKEADLASSVDRNLKSK